MIKLDLYRTVPKFGDDDDNDVDCRFNPYKIFVLETRLYPLIYRLFPTKNLEIYLKSIYNNKDRMDIFLTIKEIKPTQENILAIDEDKENKLIELSDEDRKIIQKRIDEINTKNIDYALIDIHELYDSINIYDKKSKDVNNLSNKIPFQWYKSVLEYTGLNSSYNPFIQPEGIYLTFNPLSDYKPAYYEVCRFLVDRIKDFYRRGVIIIEGESIKKDELIRNWNLISIDDEEGKNISENNDIKTAKRIFEPNWTDDRFAKNKVDFLYRKIEGDPYIRVEVPDNLVKRHGIAVALQKENIPLIFEGKYCKVEANSIEDAYYICATITAAKTISGKVLVISSARLSEIYLYFDYAEKKYGKGKCVSYQVNNGEKVFSCLVDSEDFDSLRLEFRNYALDRLIEVSKISKFKGLSPHEIIIGEYS